MVISLPVPSFFILTEAPATTAPFASAIVPLIVPVVACAVIEIAENITATKTTIADKVTVRKLQFLIPISPLEKPIRGFEQYFGEYKNDLRVEIKQTLCQLTLFNSD